MLACTNTYIRLLFLPICVCVQKRKEKDIPSHVFFFYVRGPFSFLTAARRRVLKREKRGCSRSVSSASSFLFYTLLQPPNFIGLVVITEHHPDLFLQSLYFPLKGTQMKIKYEFKAEIHSQCFLA